MRASSGLPVEFVCHIWMCLAPTCMYAFISVLVRLADCESSSHWWFESPWAGTYAFADQTFHLCMWIPSPTPLQVLDPSSYHTVSGHSAVKEFTGWLTTAVEIQSLWLRSLWYKSCALSSQHVLRVSRSLLFLASHSSKEVPKRVVVVKRKLKQSWPGQEESVCLPKRLSPRLLQYINIQQVFFGLASMCELVLCSEILSASEALVGRLWCTSLLEETIGVWNLNSWNLYLGKEGSICKVDLWFWATEISGLLTWNKKQNLKQPQLLLKYETDFWLNFFWN